MKTNPSTSQSNSNPETKTESPSVSAINFRANKKHEDDVNMPRGAESDYKDELLESKKKRIKGSLPKKPKQ